MKLFTALSILFLMTNAFAVDCVLKRESVNRKSTFWERLSMPVPGPAQSYDSEIKTKERKLILTVDGKVMETIAYKGTYSTFTGWSNKLLKRCEKANKQMVEMIKKHKCDYIEGDPTDLKC